MVREDALKTLDGQVKDSVNRELIWNLVVRDSSARVVLCSHHPYERNIGSEDHEGGDVRTGRPVMAVKDETEAIILANDTEFGWEQHLGEPIRGKQRKSLERSQRTSYDQQCCCFRPRMPFGRVSA